MRNLLIIGSIFLLSILAACGAQGTLKTGEATLPLIPMVTSTQQATQPEESLTPPGETPQAQTQNKPTGNPEPISIVAQNLQTPWEIVFLPDGRMLVTERPGILSLIETNGVRIPIADVYESSESGLLGLALHPSFAENQYLYLYLTYQANGKMLNRVERYRFDGTTLSDPMFIIDRIPGAAIHDGGRIEFGPDGFLYITTGDAGASASAQDVNSLSGKILRLHDDGSIPKDNPFGNAVYSYGHRNPQGLAWDEQGQLWSTEHGPSGLGSGYDELNLIEKGGNYGWPEIQGDQSREGMITPRLQSGGNETWAPGDLEIVDRIAYFTGLRGATLYSVPLDDIRPEALQRHFTNEFGRLRALRLGPDGLLYMGTSNTDGRGSVREGDDKIFRIDPNQLH
ncbi:MAG: PQQ-dependent sugar dehydrogenase [Anaerolineaceae bacterium]